MPNYIFNWMWKFKILYFGLCWCHYYFHESKIITCVCFFYTKKKIFCLIVSFNTGLCDFLPLKCRITVNQYSTRAVPLYWIETRPNDSSGSKLSIHKYLKFNFAGFTLKINYTTCTFLTMQTRPRQQLAHNSNKNFKSFPQLCTLQSTTSLADYKKKTALAVT
jgi:hypothetical protein